MRYVCFLLIVLMSSGVLAISGVSPSSYSVDFEPLYSNDFQFDFTFDENSVAEVYVEGDLSEYVSVDKKSIRGSDRVVASVDFPLSVEVPGTHYIFVGARQKPKGDAGVGLLSDLRGVVKVEVPYEGRYIELDLTAFDANVGEDVNLTLKAINRGNETVNFTPIIQVFDGDLRKDSIELNESSLLPRASKSFSASFNTSGYSPGNYSAAAITDYGGEMLSKSEDYFRLGEFKVVIVNYTQKLLGAGLEPFVIEIESFYNGPIEHVYAQVNLADLDVEGFTTPEISLKPFERAQLKGFFDSSVFLDGEFSVEIILHYGDSNDVSPGLLFLKKPVNYKTYIIYGLVAILLIFILWRFILFLKHMRV